MRLYPRILKNLFMWIRFEIATFFDCAAVLVVYVRISKIGRSGVKKRCAQWYYSNCALFKN